MIHYRILQKYISADSIFTGGLAPKERSRAASFLLIKFTIILVIFWNRGFIAEQLQMKADYFTPLVWRRVIDWSTERTAQMVFAECAGNIRYHSASWHSLSWFKATTYDGSSQHPAKSVYSLLEDSHWTQENRCTLRKNKALRSWEVWWILAIGFFFSNGGWIF